jgi:predicted Zn-dependent peptidase
MLLLLSTAFAQDVPFEKYTLPNGLQVILHEDPSLPQVVVDVWYRVGSGDEVAKRSGFAHLFEHLMFMGTNRLPGNGFDKEMEAHGGWNNAWTMEDATNYYDVGPATLLPTFLWMEADRMQQLGIAMTQEKLDLQRDVVRNERRQSNEDRPYGMVEIELSPALFPEGHPYAHTTIGSHEDLQAATVQDVKDFFATWYVPNNASLVVAGNFKAEEVKPLIAQYFGAVAPHELPARANPAPVTTIQKKDVQITDQVQFPQLNLAWHSPAKYAGGDAEMQLAASLLGGGESSRLYKRLVIGGLAQDLEVYQYPLRLGGVFMVTAIPAEGVTVDQIQAVVEEEIAKLAAEPPSAEEMERLKNQVRHEFLAGLEPLQDRAEQLNRYGAYTGDPAYLATDLAAFQNATAAGISAQVKQWLSPDQHTRIVVVPEATK